MTLFSDHLNDNTAGHHHISYLYSFSMLRPEQNDHFWHCADDIEGFSMLRPQQNGHYSVSPIYRGRVYRGIGYIAVACWTPFFWRPRARYFSRNRGNTLDPIRGRQFFAKSAYRDSLCSRFAGDNFSLNQLWPTCQCGLEHMLCDGQPSSAEHWHLHCIAE